MLNTRKKFALLEQRRRGGCAAATQDQPIRQHHDGRHRDGAGRRAVAAELLRDSAEDKSLVGL